MAGRPTSSFLVSHAVDFRHGCVAELAAKGVRETMRGLLMVQRRHEGFRRSPHVQKAYCRLA